MTKKKPRKLTLKQQNVLKLFPLFAAGKITAEEMLLKAGYTAKTARQQKEVMDSLRRTSAMQEALRKAKFNEDLIAEKIMAGLDAKRSFLVHDGDDSRIETATDYDAQFKFLKLGAELLDVMPSKKIDVQDVTPMTYGDLEGKKAKSVEEACALAEQASAGDDEEQEDC